MTIEIFALLDEVGTVVNVVQAEPADASAIWGASAVAGASAAIGDTWDGSQFVKPQVAPLPPTVPASVSPYQARQALNVAGLLDAVEAAVAAADRSVQIAWEYATTIERGSPFISAMKSAIGLTDQQLDDLFIAAAQIT